ncbi:adenylyl-sulfate kinase, partial [Streptomyces sp. TRM70308]|uniref:adenylyl-sulfate kinase n=1 Tax=Streptomyces sp. TRM70308 TaxID=3131932 RepID=UPI003D0837EC
GAPRPRHASSATPYVEVHVATPVDVCRARDVQGLYARQATGEISCLTGVDDPYQVPENPDLRIETHRQTAAQSATTLHTVLKERGLA